MRKFLFLLFVTPLFAQPSNSPIVSVTVAPSGACASGLPNQQVISTGVQYSCQSGTWGTVGNGSSSAYPGVTSNGANGLTVTGNVTSPNLISNGTPAIDVRAYGCALDGTTDDTTCLQNAVTACFARSGTLYIPSGGTGKLHLAGAINAACDGIICAPSVLATVPTQTCTIHGESQDVLIGTTLAPASVIQTAISAGTDASSAIIGVPSVGANFGSFDNIILRVHDLTFQTYPNPAIGGINCGKAGDCDIYNAAFWNGEPYAFGYTQPTNDRTGVILPLVNNYGLARLHDTAITGFYTGVTLSEHADIENVGVNVAIQCYKTTAGFHNAHFRHAQANECVTALVSTGGNLPVQFDLFDIETDPNHNLCSWCASSTDISDSSNYLNGLMTYTSIISGPGTRASLRVTGGANLTYPVLSGGGAYGGPLYTQPPTNQTTTMQTNSQFKISFNASSFATPGLLFDTTQVSNTFVSGPAFTASGMTAGGVMVNSFGVGLNSNYNSGNFAFKYVGAGNTGNYVALGLFGATGAVNVFGTGNTAVGAATDCGQILCVGGNIVGTGSLKLATARKGTFVCTNAGSIVVSNANYITTSDVIITMNTPGGTITTPPAFKTTSTGVSFTMLCGATDTSTYNYNILN